MSAVLDLFECAVSPRTRWSFVRIRTADGLIGYGECSDAGTTRDVAELLVGVAAEIGGLLEAREPQPIAETIGTAVDGWSALIRRTVLGGVEQALCDIAARRAGQPLWKWLGGSAPAALPLYANVNRVPGGRRPDDVAAAGVAAARAGFGAVKCAPFDEPLADHSLRDAGVARLRALRAVLGPGTAIYADCHERLPLADVLDILPELELLGIGWLEDATACTDLAGLRALRDGSTATLAGGELASTSAEVRPAVEHKLLDVVMPDVKHAGGLLRAAQIAAAVPEAQASPHNPSGPIGTAVSAHLAATLPNFSVLEYAYGEVDWRSELVDGAEQVHDGHLQIAEGPGLGLELVATHSALRHVSSLAIEEK